MWGRGVVGVVDVNVCWSHVDGLVIVVIGRVLVFSHIKISLPRVSEKMLVGIFVCF